MNEYRIAYTYTPGVAPSRESIDIIERSEPAARKFFKAHYKDGTILDVELISENATATKQQERGTLEAIRKMVAELGPDSYVGTAFEGCFQDAEDNIENDFGCSMKQRLESATFAEDELREKLAAAAARLAELGGLVGSLKDERSALEAKLAKQTIPAKLHQGLRAFVEDGAAAARQSMATAADIMAEFADAPQDMAFPRAVTVYREAKARRDVCKELASGLDAIEPDAE